MTDQSSPDKNKDTEKSAKAKNSAADTEEQNPTSDNTGETTPESEDTTARTEDPHADLLQKLEEAEARAQAAQDRALRTAAELDNYRKRMARDRQEWLRSAAAEVIESLLPALDNLKLGLQSVNNDQNVRELARGFEMVGQQMLTALQEQGLQELDPAGEDFNPYFHESLSTEPDSEVGEGKVLRTIKSGYLLNEKLLRPAMVVVSSGAPEEETGEKEASAPVKEDQD